MTDRFDPIEEIEGLHAFFETWFTGQVDRSRGTDRLETVLDEDFQMITPEGKRRDRGAVIAGVTDGYGANRDEEPPFTIEIHSPAVRQRSDTTALVTYEEWQRGQATETGRISSAWLRKAPNTPNGCRWYHLQETWMTD